MKKQNTPIGPISDRVSVCASGHTACAEKTRTPGVGDSCRERSACSQPSHGHAVDPFEGERWPTRSSAAAHDPGCENPCGRSSKRLGAPLPLQRLKGASSRGVSIGHLNPNPSLRRKMCHAHSPSAPAGGAFRWADLRRATTPRRAAILQLPLPRVNALSRRSGRLVAMGSAVTLRDREGCRWCDRPSWRYMLQSGMRTSTWRSWAKARIRSRKRGYRFSERDHAPVRN
jgi:hypothetical protein